MIQLAIVAADLTRLDTLTSAFRADAELTVIGVWEGFEQIIRLSLSTPEADVIVVDLAHPEASSGMLWGGIHILYPGARFIGVADPSVDEEALQAAVHAGVYAFVEGTASRAKLCRTAWAAYAGEVYFHPPWVYERMAALFDRLNIEARDVIQIGSLQLVLGERQTKLGHRPLPLTPLEFAVLAYLARNVGRVVTPDELLREVWECDLSSGGTANQVVCCIKRLRRKLALEPQNPSCILTVRGQGYRMLADAEWKARAAAK